MERWNDFWMYVISKSLSISIVKSSWGCRKVEYLGHRVSAEGLEAHPKDLQALVDLPLPKTLKAMQSFLGSLNYTVGFWKTMRFTHRFCMS